MVELLHLVAKLGLHARDGRLGTHAVDLVAHLKVELRGRKERHARAEDAGNVDAVQTVECEILDAHAVDGFARDHERAHDERRLLLGEVDVGALASEEGDDRLLDVGLAHDAQAVVHVQDGRAVGTRDAAVREDSGGDEAAADEVPHLFDRAAFERPVADLDVEEDGFLMVGPLFGVPRLVLFGKLDPEDKADEDRGADRADDAERIGACVGDGDVLTRVLEELERFLSGAETGRVRDGAIVDAEHLRQRQRVLEEDVERDRHGDAKEHLQDGEEVEYHAAALEGRKERGAHLKADEVDEDGEPEVAQEVEHGGIHGEAEVPRGNGREEHEGDAK